ncbi:MAG: hypothetical protein SH859_14455 [Hyphomicrobium aestuarii]|nr:hypothetical protein [Hyphomicrobium aestuarii]
MSDNDISTAKPVMDPAPVPGLSGKPLNVACACVTLNQTRLDQALTDAFGDRAFAAGLRDSHPHLVSAQPVFVSAADVEAIAKAVTAIEAVAARPAFEHLVNARAPDIAKKPPGPIGVFMGYDFHMSASGPRLIEVNTNAGGGLLNAHLREAHRTCCHDLTTTTRLPATLDATLDAYMAAFEAEWQRIGPNKGAGRPLSSVAIVDRAPSSQYLYPEFRLFEQMFRARGVDAAIADPDELAFDGEQLTLHGRRIDLVYNRLTDFYLDDPASAALRASYAAGTTAITPNPWVHAHYADKRNLVVLSDSAALASMGLEAEHIATLRDVVPATSLVTPQTADANWAVRKHLFFKPFGGHGGKAAYRGDKLTRTVFAEIAKGGYIAQELVAPSVRTVMVDGVPQLLKADVRAYTYDGQIQLVAARLYQGQMTNFRTPGGGFAPVLIVADVMAACGCA